MSWLQVDGSGGDGDCGGCGYGCGDGGGCYGGCGGCGGGGGLLSL